jgi:hypothetical protein
MDFWRRSARKSRKEKVRNVTIREIMEVGKNSLEVTEEKRLRWFGHVKRMSGNRLPLKVLEWEPEGTRRRGRPKERWIDTSTLDGGEWSASRPGRAFTPGESTPGTHCTGGWVGLRAGLDTEARGKISCLCRESNPDRPVVQPVVRHYTD